MILSEVDPLSLHSLLPQDPAQHATWQAVLKNCVGLSVSVLIGDFSKIALSLCRMPVYYRFKVPVQFLSLELVL